VLSRGAADRSAGREASAARFWTRTTASFADPARRGWSRSSLPQDEGAFDDVSFGIDQEPQASTPKNEREAKASSVFVDATFAHGGDLTCPDPIEYGLGRYSESFGN
jgi:hypothetical protein